MKTRLTERSERKSLSEFDPALIFINPYLCLIGADANATHMI